MTKKFLHGMRAKEGFTLIELMVVVVIIGVLSAMIIPKFGTQVERAKERRAMAELSSMKTIIDLYYLENDVYPEGDAKLKAVLGENGIEWAKDGGIQDPWGEDYIYKTETNNNGYEIRSGGYGPSDSKYVAATDSKEPAVVNGDGNGGG
ncbi:MAG TPA: type II secretion system protein GspG [Clostridia bacterium]|nr:type II secretion system protein GspG [Clostridia bacterium]